MVNEERRSFLRWAVHGLGSLFTVILGGPAVLYLIDPRNRPAPNRDFRPVQGIDLDTLPVNEPQQGVILDIRRDAWSLYPNDVIGRVWVVKQGPGTYKAFTTICPHLGCSINLDPPGQNRGFTCPCHGGKFLLNGALKPNVANNPAPRSMDELDCRPDPNNPKVLLVRYQNFYQGEHEKKVKA